MPERLFINTKQMKQLLFLALLMGSIHIAFGQDSPDTLYQSEVRRIQKLVELNLMKNSDLFCADYIGSTLWLVLSKETNNQTKVHVISADQLVRKKFEFLASRPITVTWPTVDKEFSSLMIIQPIAVTCLDQERIDQSSWFTLSSMLDQLFNGKPAKMIVFKTMTFDIGTRVNKE
jgi:hypothetical protein